jgi:hypothetical protein
MNRPTKSILVIDDERIFPSLEGDGVVVIYARIGFHAMQMLRDTTWDEVWFDHDLGRGEWDGTQLVSWMREEQLDWPRRIGRAFVHSMNPVGAANLRSRLKDLGIVTYRVGLPEGHTVA